MSLKGFINQKLGKKLTHRQASNKSKLQFEHKTIHQRGLVNGARVKISNKVLKKRNGVPF